MRKRFAISLLHAHSILVASITRTAVGQVVCEITCLLTSLGAKPRLRWGLAYVQHGSLGLLSLALGKTSSCANGLMGSKTLSSLVDYLEQLMLHGFYGLHVFPICCTYLMRDRTLPTTPLAVFYNTSNHYKGFDGL